MGCCFGKAARPTKFKRPQKSYKAMLLVESDDESEDGSNFECPICLGSSTKTIHATPCAHLFHTKCLATWLQRSPECPTCRQKIVV